MRQLKRIVTKLEKKLWEKAGQKTSSFHPDCICFPSDEQPIFSFHVEREAARNVKGPLHGERFRPGLFILYKAGWRRNREFEEGWPDHSPQYRKAMRASFPSSLWPAEAKWVQGTGVVLTFKDGTSRPAYDEQEGQVSRAGADQALEAV